MSLSPIDFFFDPILRGPTLGCMLMCLSTALIGVIVYLKKISLFGEALSHATYPGVILAALVTGIFFPQSEQKLPFLILIFASLFAWVALNCIRALNRFLKIKKDAALCFTLTAFFGIGVTLASYVQFSYSSLYSQAQVYLFGQAATMTDKHIWIYGVFSLLAIIIVTTAHKEILATNFDKNYSQIIGIKTKLIEHMIQFLLICSIVIGIRCVGLILISGMLIAPAVASRQFSKSIKMMFFLASLFGIFAAYIGVYSSVQISIMASEGEHLHAISLPTGPMITVTAAIICLFSLLFAPKRGVVLRYMRVLRFRQKCLIENILKSMWRINCSSCASLSQLKEFIDISSIHFKFILFFLIRHGWVLKKTRQGYELTNDGRQKAEQIIRLHRLWEVYLVDYLGVGEERVHKNAEEMEHIITPDLEKKLTELMKDPKQDPHNQPIPPMRGV